MGDLETSLTWSEGIKLFQDGLYNVIKTRRKKHESPGEQKLSDLLPNEDENTTHQIAELLDKLARNGGSRWKTALDSAQISIVHTRYASYKITFKYHVLPTIQLVDCIPDKKKNLLIVDPPSIEDTSRHASKSKQNHLRAALKVVAANNAGSSEKTATKNKKKRKFSEVLPQFINVASPSMRIDDAAMEEEAEAEAEEQEEDSADLDIPEDEDIEWWKSLDDDIDNDIDSQNNENESILCNLASYYNSIVDTVVSTLTTP